MGDPAEKIDTRAADALGARVLRQLDPETTAEALAWLRGEGPCPSIG